MSAAATPVGCVKTTARGSAARRGVAAGAVSGRRGVSSSTASVVVARGVRRDGENVAGAAPSSEENTQSRRAVFVDAAALLASAAVLPAFADEEEVVAEAVEAATAVVEAAAPAPPAPPPPPPPPPVKAVPLTTVAQPVMAYEFSYPSENADGAPIRWTPSRVRDTYSSAEPMSPDARQRIVYELISFKGPMTATVTVGPAPPKLAAKDPAEWKPQQVAEAVLADRATGRIATGQKVSLAEVETATKEVIGGVEYVYYEYISQGSPNLAERESTTFRHSLGVTARRGVGGVPGGRGVQRRSLTTPDSRHVSLDPPSISLFSVSLDDHEPRVVESVFVESARLGDPRNLYVKTC
jgi:hypothetical protein